MGRMKKIIIIIIIIKTERRSEGGGGGVDRNKRNSVYRIEIHI